MKQRPIHSILLPCIFLFLVILSACDQGPKYPGPLSPEESMKTFRFADPFKAELFASEPLVAVPISMVFNDNGDAYVMEMPDSNMPDSLRGKGQIVVLKDLDGDGKADTSIVFAKDLKEATTMLPWDGGMIVTAAPDIWYFKDTNGDGVADKKEKLFSGFFTGNEEAQITSLRFNVDNWIYANNNGNPGKIVSHLSPEADTLDLAGADFRFRMDTKEFERTTGPGQFGQAIDDWGHRFFTNNTLHIRQVVIPERYLSRNPYLPSDQKRAITNISDHDLRMYQLSETPYWRQERTDRRNEAFKEKGLPESEYARDHFTGASGGTFYGGDGLGKDYYGSIFTGEVAGNLVHRDILSSPSDPQDPFYRAKRGEQEQKQEFMATEDTWFRPTNFAVGPDGYLYVIDMYQQHIETPVSIPDDLAEDMDFAEGNDKGRIYRIVREDKAGNEQVSINLHKASSQELVKYLSHPNRWYRRNAHRILIEKHDESVIADVKDLWASDEAPEMRLEALFILDGLGALDQDIVKEALKDESPGIRENAAILAEKFPETLPALIDLVEDSSTRVVFQATLSLGEFSDKKVTEALLEVLKKYGSNSWFRTAVLSSEAGSSEEIMKSLKEDTAIQEESWEKEFMEKLSSIIEERNKAGNK